MSPTETVVARIKKLLALANNNSNPEEAALAAQRAQELMVRHAIDEGMLEKAGSPEAKNEPIEVQGLGMQTRKIPRWMVRLSWRMAPHFFCQGYFTQGSDIYVVGRRTDREAHIATFEYLVSEVRRLCEVRWAEVPSYASVNGKTWKTSFCEGAVATILERLDANRKKLEAGIVEEDTAQGTSTAIVLRSRVEAVELFVKATLNLHNTQASRKKHSHDAYYEGKAAGHTISLDRRATKQLAE